MKLDEATEMLRAALQQYSAYADRDMRWSAVHSLGLKFSKVFSFGEMQEIASAATDTQTIDVVDKAWSGIRCKDGVMWFS